MTTQESKRAEGDGMPPVATKSLVSFQSSASEPERKKVWSGQRLLGRTLAVPFNYAELYRNPEAARRGEFDPTELLAKTTCAGNGGEDES
jgi:hypothetical protein